MLGWPRVQSSVLGVFCPPSLASLRGGSPVLTSGFLGGRAALSPGTSTGCLLQVA